jgi:hypothetical protein
MENDERCDQHYDGKGAAGCGSAHRRWSAAAAVCLWERPAEASWRPGGYRGMGQDWGRIGVGGGGQGGVGVGAAVGGGGVATARVTAPARCRWGTKAAMGPPRGWVLSWHTPIPSTDV